MEGTGQLCSKPDAPAIGVRVLAWQTAVRRIEFPTRMADVRRIPPSQRHILSGLLDPRSVSDALAAYYGLLHPVERVALFGFFPGNHVPSGFLALARTGMDLFRPLAVPFVGTVHAMTALLRVALEPSRPVLLHVPLEQRSWVEEVAELTDTKPIDLLRLDTARYRPVINVLVVETAAPGGWPRFEIRSGEDAVAAAGVNWIGTSYAEIYLEVAEVAMGRGFGRSVLSALASRLVADGKVPIYPVTEDDWPTVMEAEELGFRRTGDRRWMAQALRRDPGAA